MSENTQSSDITGNGRQPYFTWKLPFGMEIKVGGKEVFTVIILFLLATPLTYFLIKHDESMRIILINLEEAQEATTYVLTLSQEERQKLNLTKPKKIREMERN